MGRDPPWGGPGSVRPVTAPFSAIQHPHVTWHGFVRSTSSDVGGAGDVGHVDDVDPKKWMLVALESHEEMVDSKFL